MGIINNGIIKTSALSSVIGESSIINPKSEGHKREVHAELLLTALIDAFSILVIFLLMSFSSAGDVIQTGKGIQLPKATQGEILDRQPVVKVEEGKIFVEDKEVPVSGLVASLLDLRKTFQKTRPGEEFPGIITIQGDRRLKYEILNSIVLASSQAGYSDIKFAVLAE
ncbi:MAG: biopolymer transporter ExbD [Proteobacteria bacterium]|nr:MAG: biopolymer transporter ExbD [Pseudomonadota bacterium]